MSESKSILPDPQELLMSIVQRNKDGEFNHLKTNGDLVKKAMEEYAQQCVEKALEIAAEEADITNTISDDLQLIDDNGRGRLITIVDKQSILKLKSDPRLKP